MVKKYRTINKIISCIVIVCLTTFGLNGCATTATISVDLGSQKVFLKEEVVKTIEKPVIQLQITKNPTPYYPYIECEVTRYISEVITTEKSYQQIKKKDFYSKT
jgi:hypothetical protein